MDTNKIQERISAVTNSGRIKSFSIIILTVLILLGYAFFFNSTKFFGKNFDFNVAEIGDTIILENGHTVKLSRADVDLKKNIVEFEFYFLNTNFDGYNDYNIVIKSADENGNISTLQPITVCSDSDVYVVRATITKSWSAVVADITLKNKENKTLEAKFYQTNETLYQTTITDETSRDYFLRLGVIRRIELIQSTIDDLKEINNDLNSKIKSIDENISTLQNRLNYMTAEELSETERKISQMIAEKNSALAEIDNNIKTIKEYEDSIVDLQYKLNGG